ncbi:MAG TPA: PH domain-containing protein, partial [Candidatus Binatia bacterium]|nr:PH domain-containing protein [Candidatus Binatia bacterium]
IIAVVADAALLEVDEEITKSLQTSAGEAMDDDAEKVLWEGRPFLSLNTRYVITNERVRIVEGILGKDREDIELVRIQDIDQSQSISERLLNIGDILIRSHDTTNPQAVIRNVKDPQAVHEILRRAVLDARKRHKLVYREEM